MPALPSFLRIPRGGPSPGPRRRTLAVALAGLLVAATGATATSGPGQDARPDAKDLAPLWVAPEGERDLFHGPGGAALAPDTREPFRVVEIKFGGYSSGYHVVDAADREWSVKFPPEAAPEVVASRIHWGVGFHQPPIYFVPEWRAEGALAPNPQLPARFRQKDPDFHGLDEVSDWAYDDNPFVGTRPLAGLIVLQVLLGNSDLKASNNSKYELDEPVEGARVWYVARDIGHTFGRTGVFDAPRGDIEVFERTPFIRGLDGDRVLFDYRGRHADLLAHVTVDDVHWICERLARLTDRQWNDAFRAGGYPPALAARFIAQVKARIAAGLALPVLAPSAVPGINPGTRPGTRPGTMKEQP